MGAGKDEQEKQCQQRRARRVSEKGPRAFSSRADVGNEMQTVVPCMLPPRTRQFTLSRTRRGVDSLCS